MGQMACSLGVAATQAAAITGEDKDWRRTTLTKRIISHIDNHLFDAELSGDTLQRTFHLSRATLYRLFQNIGGVAHHIRARRLSWAHAYLRDHPDCSITWVLYEAGFNSERQFQRAFQAYFGMAPACWRKRCQDSHPQHADEARTASKEHLDRGAFRNSSDAIPHSNDRGVYEQLRAIHG
ncbi:AraC family transcriptional regulator [Pseudoxanthomonas sp.]|uniref:helix-turn-helix domain-containing protein n=1 Tax=Pseudoxanthomonas sp. TaxID=1871049 RepID=UPI00262715B5|nr:AraC family transcriptional regulator [Pseudoxanthomonas sp.]WDS37820.1 MAG: AraC family transcriptional regulator [Pseudoxanthomonas sp.]